MRAGPFALRAIAAGRGVAAVTVILAATLASGCMESPCRSNVPLRGEVTNETNQVLNVRMVLVDDRGGTLVDRREDMGPRTTTPTGAMAFAEGRYRLTVSVGASRTADSELMVGPCYFDFTVWINDTSILISQPVA